MKLSYNYSFAHAKLLPCLAGLIIVRTRVLSIKECRRAKVRIAELLGAGVLCAGKLQLILVDIALPSHDL
jgi:hypothetical protein